MLYQAILFVVAKSAPAHRSHDNPKIELSGSAPIKNIFLSIVAASLLIVGMGNSKAQASDNGVLGIIIGGATGGFIGSHIGNGRGQLAATAAGALLGAAIGNQWGENTYRTWQYKTVYNPIPRSRYAPVYQPPHEPSYYPAYAPKRNEHRGRVVVHKHKVIVKHVYVNQKKHNRTKRKMRRRDRSEACYYHPRRCAQAF